MMRNVPNGGHPGAILSLSAIGNKDGILWAAIHAIGDSWHESRPGVLHAYEVEDIRHELWNSLEDPTRDNCGEYSKMARPTIANGRVSLASFGSENVGTGQFCVYGLLSTKDALRLAASSAVSATVVDKRLTLTWAAVSGAQVYRVFRKSTFEPEPKRIALRVHHRNLLRTRTRKGRVDVLYGRCGCGGRTLWRCVVCRKDSLSKTEKNGK